MSATLKFPDVSHYQAALSLTGAPAVLAKTTEGTGFVDASFAGFMAQADHLGIPAGAYHWVNTEDLQGQAANCWTHCQGRPVMWDAEADGSTVPRLVELTNRFRDLGGTVHIVYLPRWWWEGHLGSPSLQPLIDAGLYLVSSNYPPGGYTDNGPGWAPYGGMTPVQWQYTSTQSFNGQRVDFNAFKGTAAQWWALISGGSMAGYSDRVDPDALTNDYRTGGMAGLVSPVTVPGIAAAVSTDGKDHPARTEKLAFVEQFQALRKDVTDVLDLLAEGVPVKLDDDTIDKLATALAPKLAAAMAGMVHGTWAMTEPAPPQ